MAFTVEDFRDLARILEERPEWRAELRRLVLTDELLALPEQTERRFQELTEQIATLAKTQGQFAEEHAALTRTVQTLSDDLAALTRTVQTLSDDLAALTRTVQTLSDDVGELKGDSLERRYREMAFAYFGRLIRRAHVLMAEELSDLLEEAVGRGVLSEADSDEVTWADLIVRGRRRDDGTVVSLVVEVSWGVGPHDVERASHRAALLARIASPVLPVVAGKAVTEEAARLARTQAVWQLLDGQVIPPDATSVNA